MVKLVKEEILDGFLVEIYEIEHGKKKGQFFLNFRRVKLRADGKKSHFVKKLHNIFWESIEEAIKSVKKEIDIINLKDDTKLAKLSQKVGLNPPSGHFNLSQLKEALYYNDRPSKLLRFIHLGYIGSYTGCIENDQASSEHSRVILYAARAYFDLMEKGKIK